MKTPIRMESDPHVGPYIDMFQREDTLKIHAPLPPFALGECVAFVVGTNDADRKEKAERIVVCLNACTGVSNEALESGVLQDLITALREMDSLVEALWEKVDWGKSFLNADAIQRLNEAPLKAKAILAKLETGKGETP